MYTYIYILLIVMIVKLKKVDKLWSFPLVVFSGIDTVSMGSPAVGVIPSESYNSPSLTLKMTWFLPQMPFACAKLGLTEDGAQDEMQNSWSDGWGLVCGRGLSTCNLHCWLVSWAINMVGRTIWFIVDTYRLCSYTGISLKEPLFHGKQCHFWWLSVVDLSPMVQEEMVGSVRGARCCCSCCRFLIVILFLSGTHFLYTAFL